MTISNALASLHPDDRSIVVEAFYQAMSVTEIAHREQISERDVILRLHQATHALRTAIRGQGIEH